MNKLLSIVLIFAILGAVGTLFYTVAKPARERFTEFYLLGINGQAADYPTHFIMESSSLPVSGTTPQLFNVQYGENKLVVDENWGKVTLNIVNHERQTASYDVKMEIDGQAAEIPIEGDNVQKIGPIVLAPENKWEQEIGIIPRHKGENQKVELFLYKDGRTELYLNLHLLISVE